MSLWNTFGFRLPYKVSPLKEKFTQKIKNAVKLGQLEAKHAKEKKKRHISHVLLQIWQRPDLKPGWKGERFNISGVASTC